MDKELYKPFKYIGKENLNFLYMLKMKKEIKN